MPNHLQTKCAQGGRTNPCCTTTQKLSILHRLLAAWSDFLVCDPTKVIWSLSVLRCGMTSVCLQLYRICHSISKSVPDVFEPVFGTLLEPQFFSPVLQSPSPFSLLLMVLSILVTKKTCIFEPFICYSHCSPQPLKLNFFNHGDRLGPVFFSMAEKSNSVFLQPLGCCQWNPILELVVSIPKTKDNVKCSYCHMILAMLEFFYLSKEV